VTATVAAQENAAAALPSRARAPHRRRRSTALRWRRVLLGAAGIVGFLLLWEIASRTGLVNPQYLPPPTVVFGELFRQLTTATFWTAVRQTMTSWAVGLAIVAVSGTVLGFLIGLSRFLKRFTASTIEFLRPIPSVALVPLAVLVFGIKPESAILLIVYAGFWQMLIQVLYGVSDVDPVAESTARTYGLGRWARIRYVVWPSALPYIVTGLRLSATIALVLAITAELVIGVPGIGSQIVLAQNGARVPTVYALALATGVLGLLVNFALRLVETRLLSWHSSIRSEVV